MFAAVGERYYKVTSEALRVCSELISVVRPSPASTFDFKPYTVPMYTAIEARLTAQDQVSLPRALLFVVGGLGLKPGWCPRGFASSVSDSEYESLRVRFAGPGGEGVRHHVHGAAGGSAWGRTPGAAAGVPAAIAGALAQRDHALGRRQGSSGACPLHCTDIPTSPAFLAQFATLDH